MTRTATIRPDVADHERMVGEVCAVFARAGRADRAAGGDWYPTAGRMVGAIASSSGIAEHRVAHALAALSPRNPWRWNVADAYAYAHAAAAGDGRPSATTFESNRRAAWSALLEPGAPWASAAPKVRAFVAAILGDLHSVVVDVWAVRVATGGRLSNVRPAEYARVAAAYQSAAQVLGIAPRDLQAITWIVAQREGLGSARRSNHAASFKRGTPDAVRLLFNPEA